MDSKGLAGSGAGEHIKGTRSILSRVLALQK